MPTVCRLAVAVFAIVSVVSNASAGRTSTDVYEARSYRVDLADGSQSPAAPYASNGWGYGEAIPYSARQDDLVLREGDPLAVWFPSFGGSTSISGPRTYINRMPQVDFASGVVTLDRYHRLESHLGLQVLVGASESSYWVGSLPAGDYEFVLNDWDLPGIENDPLAGLLSPPNLTTPWSLDIPNATLANSMSWRFSVIPEPATLMLALIGLAAFGRQPR